MTALVISRVAIDDPAAMQSYFDDAPDVVEAHGGQYLVRTTEVTPVEGEWSHHRVVVVRFPSIEAARAWYDSEDYRNLRDLRQRSSRAQIIFVPEEPAD